jgi:regulator of RNase E activity RraA
VSGHRVPSALSVTRVTELFDGLSSTVVSDALDQLGINGALVDIAPIGVGARMIGLAQTVLQEPRPAEVPAKTITATHSLFVDHEVRAGAVIVVSTPIAPVASSWGYLLSLRSLRLGAAGTVIDGSVRDPLSILETGYPVFASKGRQVSAGSKLRLSTVGTDVPVTCAGVAIEPGDVILGDDSGVVACPRAMVEIAAALAREISEAENELERRVRAGGYLSENG